jgi:hypothetical protein
MTTNNLAAPEQLYDAIMAAQNNEPEGLRRCLEDFNRTAWSEVDILTAALFYNTCHTEWPYGPEPPQLDEIATLLARRYDPIIAVPYSRTQVIIESVFTGNFSVVGSISRNELLTLQLLTFAALTTRHDVTGQRLSALLKATAEGDWNVGLDTCPR